MIKPPVRRDEWFVTSLMFSYIFGTLMFYYVLKPLRSGLFLKNFPSSHLPYAYFLTAFLAGTIATLIFKLHGRLSLIKMLTGINLAIIATLLYFRWAMGRNISFIPYIYFVYVQIVSVLSTTQFWLLAGYIYDSQQSKRIFPLLASGAIFGAMAGSAIPGFLSARLSTQSMLLICIGICSLLIMISLIAWRHRRPEAERADARKFREPRDRISDLLRLAFGSHHLTLMIILIFLTLIASQISDWQVDAAAQAHYSDVYSHLSQNELKAAMESSVNELRGRFYFFTNIIGLTLQATLTGLVVRRFGIGAAILFLPAGLFLTSIGVFLLPTLYMAVLSLGSNSVFRYSINRVGLELLWLPLSPEARKKTKVFIDVFVDRFGRAVAGVIILAMTGTVVTLGLRGTAIAIALLCAACVAVCIMLRRSYVEAFRQKLARHEVDLTEIRRYVNDPASVRLLTAALESGQERRVIYSLRLLQSIRGVDFSDKLLPLIGDPSPLIRAEAARTMVALPDFDPSLGERLLSDPSDAVREAAVEYLCSHADPDTGARIQMLLQHEHPAARKATARWLADNPSTPYIPSASRLQELLGLQDTDARTTAARLSARLPMQDGIRLLRSSLQDPDPGVAAAAARAAGKAGLLDVVIDITRMLPDRSLRPAARDALVSYGARIAGTLGDILADPKQDIKLRREIPWVLSRIEVPRSLEVLLDSLAASDERLKYRIIKALNRLHEQRPDQQIPLKAVEAHIYAEARSYYELLTSLQSLSTASDGQPRALLVRSLREHTDRHLEAVFRLLGLHYSQRDIYAAYLALRARHADRRASAIEFLDSMLQKDLKAILLPLIEEKSVDRIIERASRLFGLQVPDPEEAIGSLLHQEDPWLKSCALHEIGTKRLGKFTDACRALAGERDPLIRETAAWAVAQLAR